MTRGISSGSIEMVKTERQWMKIDEGRHKASQRQECRRAQSPKAIAACSSRDSEQDCTVKDQGECTEGSRRSRLEDS